MFDRNVPVVERLSLVRVPDRFVCFATYFVEDVGEATRDFRIVIFDDVHVQNSTELRKVLSQLVLSGAAWNTSDVDVAVVFCLNFDPLLIIDAIIASRW